MGRPRPPKVRSEEGSTVMALLRGIKDGSIKPSGISALDRLGVVEHFLLEGLEIVKIAEILQVNERTVRRDIQKIRQENAVHYSPRFAAEAVGRIISGAGDCIQQLRRRSRKGGSNLMEETLAVQAEWKIHRELFEALQRVGYIPTVPTEFRGEVHHSVDAEAKDAEWTLAETRRLEAIGGIDRLPKGMREKFARLKQEAQIVEESGRKAIAVASPASSNGAETGEGESKCS